MVVTNQEMLDKLLKTVGQMPICLRPQRIFVTFDNPNMHDTIYYSTITEGRRGEYSLNK